jgi:hypothetical protein
MAKRPPRSPQSQLLPLARDRVDAPVEAVHEVQVGVEAQALGASEQVAVGPVGAHARAVDRGVSGRDAEQASGALRHLHEQGQIASRVEGFRLAHPHGAERLDASDRRAALANGLGRVRVARLGVDEGSHHGRVDGLCSAHGNLADPGPRTGVDREGHVERLGAMVDHGLACGDLGERVAAAAEMVDEARLNGEHRGRACRFAVPDPQEAGRQVFRREGGTGAGVPDRDRSQGVERSRFDADPDRHRRAVPVGLGPESRGASGRCCRRAWTGSRAECDAIDCDRDLPVIVARSPQGIGQLGQVGLGAAHQAVAVRRGLLAQAVQGRRVLKRLTQALVVDALEGEPIGDGVDPRARHLLLGPEQAEGVEEVDSLRWSASGEGERQGRNQDGGQGDGRTSPAQSGSKLERHQRSDTGNRGMKSTRRSGADSSHAVARPTVA